MAYKLRYLGSVPSRGMSTVVATAKLNYLTSARGFVGTLVSGQRRVLGPATFVRSAFGAINTRLTLLLGVRTCGIACMRHNLDFRDTLVSNVVDVTRNGRRMLTNTVSRVAPADRVVRRHLKLLGKAATNRKTRFFLLDTRGRRRAFTRLGKMSAFVAQVDTPRVDGEVRRFLGSRKLTPRSVS